MRRRHKESRIQLSPQTRRVLQVLLLLLLIVVLLSNLALLRWMLPVLLFGGVLFWLQRRPPEPDDETLIRDLAESLAALKEVLAEREADLAALDSYLQENPDPRAQAERERLAEEIAAIRARCIEAENLLQDVKKA